MLQFCVRLPRGIPLACQRHPHAARKQRGVLKKVPAGLIFLVRIKSAQDQHPHDSGVAFSNRQWPIRPSKTLDIAMHRVWQSEHRLFDRSPGSEPARLLLRNRDPRMPRFPYPWQTIQSRSFARRNPIVAPLSTSGVYTTTRTPIARASAVNRGSANTSPFCDDAPVILHTHRRTHEDVCIAQRMQDASAPVG